MDIRRGRLMPYDGARENAEERHVCPLQLDVIDRCLSLWSNPDDILLTPFMGVGSEVYEAVRTGRKAIGIELKSTYYRQARSNLARVDKFELQSEYAIENGHEDESASPDEIMDNIEV
jgi:DNA modification methylase